MATEYEIRYASHPADAKSYDTNRLREEFLVSDIMQVDKIKLVYSYFERYIVGGVVPVNKAVELESIDPLKAEYFLERRELGIINVGGPGRVTLDGKEFPVNFKEALYVGKGTKKVTFISDDKNNPAHFYLNSANAHTDYPSKLVTFDDAEHVHLGSLETSNERVIHKLLVNGVIETCQLQMGMTELQTGSVWNTMPAHLHSRRNEVYFYFEVPEEQRVCHFMGQPQETRHLWMKNEEAVLSAPWSLHSAAGTSNYSFIWGMAGENLDYGDMDVIQPGDLK